MTNQIKPLTRFFHHSFPPPKTDCAASTKATVSILTSGISLTTTPKAHTICGTGEGSLGTVTFTDVDAVVTLSGTDDTATWPAWSTRAASAPAPAPPLQVPTGSAAKPPPGARSGQFHGHHQQAQRRGGLHRLQAS
jgi:hypothetical protein